MQISTRITVSADDEAGDAATQKHSATPVRRLPVPDDESNAAMIYLGALGLGRKEYDEAVQLVQRNIRRIIR